MMSVRSLDELAHAVQFVRTGETFVGPRREERVEVAVGLLHCGGELSDGLGKVETARLAGGLEPFENVGVGEPPAATRPVEAVQIVDGSVLVESRQQERRSHIAYPMPTRTHNASVGSDLTAATVGRRSAP